IIIFVILINADAENILLHPIIPPVDGSVIACDDQTISFTVVPAGSTGVRILVFEPPSEIGESPSGYDAGDWGRFVDTLISLGFAVDIVPSSTDLSDVLNSYDIFILYGYPGRIFSSEEIDTVNSFLTSGGGIFSIVRAHAGDLSEIDVHNSILSIAGMNYSPPRLTIYDTISNITSHPLGEGITDISTYKPMPISSSAGQQVVITDDDECIAAADSSLGGRIFAAGEEHLISNGPLIFGGIPVCWDDFDNKQLVLNAVYWLSLGREHPGCGLDSSSITITIDGATYDLTSPEFSLEGNRLIFSPSSGFWTSGTHTISVHIEDSCGHNIDENYDAVFDVDPPIANLIYPPTGELLSSGDSAKIFVRDYETGIDTANCFIVVDDDDTFSLWETISDVGFAVLPYSGWSVGTHEICIHAEDSPDFCSPNILDSCFTVELTEDTLWVEIADNWVEGCTLVYTEVCVHSAHYYVKDLNLENFAFYENGIQVVPPSLEILNTCPSESAMVDIVLLLDFSTSMNDEVAMFFGAIPSFVAALGALQYRIACWVFNGCPGELDGVGLIARTDFSSSTCEYSATGPDWWASNLTEFNCLFRAVRNDMYTWPWSLRGSGTEDQYGAVVRANEALDFRDGALKAFVLFTDERPIVDSLNCSSPLYSWTDVGLDSIIAYCQANDIVLLPVTPEDGEFAYATGESPSRAYYEGYPIAAESTGGRWFYLYSDDYDSLATQIGVAIQSLPCCYLFRYRESQFCNDLNHLAVDVFDGDINYGRDDTVYVPPCPGWAEFVFPDSCGGITTCARQWTNMDIIAGDEYFQIDESSLIFEVSGYGVLTLENDELTLEGTGDTLSLNFTPSHDYENGDTVCTMLMQAFDTLGCPIAGDTCCFIVDLQPPVFFDIFPPPDTIMETVEITASIRIYDSIAGVRWEDVGNDNFTVIVNGETTNVFIYSDHPYMFIELTTLRNGDSVEICVDSIPDDPDYDYCPPNYSDTCWSFSIHLREGPIAEPIFPYGISACLGQEIWISITDSDGVDSSTIVAVFNGDTFRCSDEELSYINDTLFFRPPDDYWSDGETVFVQLIAADDIYGTALQSPISWTFYIDYSPPLASIVVPDDSAYTLDEYQQIQISISDNLAGIEVDSSYVIIDDNIYTLAEVLSYISPDSLSGTIAFAPEQFGLRWYEGDTIEIFTHLCDSPDLCGPNCAEYRWVFYLPPPFGCGRMPNPFTPNGDGINDYVQFTFPGLIYKSATIYIFDLHNVLIAKINVPVENISAGGGNFGAKELSRWNGRDNNGRPVPEGLYLYIIEVNGEIVCDGTVTVAR
ncbi:gliding motility-associated C-terminal domain-containing protein, partial [bacterium]|nr:gliding motility-associated C-terminal domain-containing protein [bacterium]